MLLLQQMQQQQAQIQPVLQQQAQMHQQQAQMQPVSHFLPAQTQHPFGHVMSNHDHSFQQTSRPLSDPVMIHSIFVASLRTWSHHDHLSSCLCWSSECKTEKRSAIRFTRLWGRLSRWLLRENWHIKILFCVLSSGTSLDELGWVV